MVAPAAARYNAPDAAIILMEGKSSDHNSNLPSVTFADLLAFFPDFSSLCSGGQLIFAIEVVNAVPMARDS
jgi:hypothetical protein